MQETLIEINRRGLPPFSARGCTQVLKPIRTGELRRSINGELCYLGLETHQKYWTEIHCQDKISPALEGLWQGEEVSLSCLQRICQETSPQRVSKLERPAVPGSVKAFTQSGDLLDVIEMSETEVSLTQPLVEEQRFFITYRPHLTMRVTFFSLETQEWQAKVGWRLCLEEI